MLNKSDGVDIIVLLPTSWGNVQYFTFKCNVLAGSFCKELFFFFLNLFLFTYFWLCWVFISVRGLSL